MLWPKMRTTATKPIFRKEIKKPQITNSIHVFWKGTDFDSIEVNMKTLHIKQDLPSKLRYNPQRQRAHSNVRYKVTVSGVARAASLEGQERV